MAELVFVWHIGRLCLATAPLGLRMWMCGAAPWKGKRAVSSGLQEGRRGSINEKGLIFDMLGEADIPTGAAF